MTTLLEARALADQLEIEACATEELHPDDSDTEVMRRAAVALRSLADRVEELMSWRTSLFWLAV